MSRGIPHIVMKNGEFLRVEDLDTVCGGTYLGVCVFDSPSAIYLTGAFVGDFSLLFINIMKDI